MFEQRNMFRLTVISIIILALVGIATFTPVIPWLTGAPLPIVETPQPTTSPAESPAAPPTVVEPSPTTEISQPENTIIFSEEELQSKLDGLSDMVNQSGKAKVEYIHVKLEQDRMLVSVKGEAMGHQAEAEELEVRFEEKTVFVSGKVSALGFNPTLIVEAEINCEAGKPSANVTKFELGGLLPLLKMLGLGLSKDKISGLINDAIEDAGIEVAVDLESIRIEDEKLIVVYKEQGLQE